MATEVPIALPLIDQITESLRGPQHYFDRYFTASEVDGFVGAVTTSLPRAVEVPHLKAGGKMLFEYCAYPVFHTTIENYQAIIAGSVVVMIQKPSAITTRLNVGFTWQNDPDTINRPYHLITTAFSFGSGDMTSDIALSLAKAGGYDIEAMTRAAVTDPNTTLFKLLGDQLLHRGIQLSGLSLAIHPSHLWLAASGQSTQ